jgi:hypothetical protein
MITHLHTTPAQLDTYVDEITHQLTNLALHTKELRDLCRAELTALDDAPTGTYATALHDLISDKLYTAAAVEDRMRFLRDLFTLLTHGDTGPSAMADADPNNRSRQAHHQQRNEALARLTEQGILTTD